MSRSWRITLVFGLGLAAVFAAMGWITVLGLRLERSEAQARERAVLEENVRLALWRMDSAVASLFARENARPHYAYSAFYPAEPAHTRMFARIEPGEVLVPSPLLTEDFPFVRLHFTLDPEGRILSPQAPTGNTLDLAESAYVSPRRTARAAERLEELKQRLDREALVAALGAGGPGAAPPQLAMSAVPEAEPRVQRRRNELEWRARVSNVGQMIAQNPPEAAGQRVAQGVRVGPMRALWADDMLVFARLVVLGGNTRVQGCWLDWPALAESLTDSTRDLLPEARLEPADAALEAQPGRMLAALPVRLVPGRLTAPPRPLLTPVRLALGAAWVCLLLAAGVSATFLHGLVSLSERRAAFASAVAHELRSPLTTFRIYAEMLAERMVPDEERRRLYVQTLRSEAERLSHLVENVLAFSRLENGRRGAAPETLPLRGLLDRVGEGLQARASRADMQLVVEASPDADSASVRADPTGVHQILFNLVDNACKYASGAADRRIHLEVSLGEGHAELRVRDHGPGIPDGDRKRIFLPFRKSVRDAAQSAPGVGLGLALSRRLARRMGGDLLVDGSCRGGACFVLRLARP